MLGIKTVILAPLVAFVCMMSRPAGAAVLFENFDDGNFDGWIVHDPLNPGRVPLTPAIVSSPEGYSIRGVGSGYSASGEAAYLVRPFTVSDADELAIEMRAKSGPEWPNHSFAMMCSGEDHYRAMVYGEANRWAYFSLDIGGLYVDAVHDIGQRAYEWHTYKWSRDAQGLWSVAIDGVTEAANFLQDSRLTSFDSIALAVVRDQSEIEWVRISTDPVVPGDANGDGVVDDLDLTALATHWQQYGGLAEGDFNGDGFISQLDLTALATAWPAPGAPGAIPEPATLSLLALLALSLPKALIHPNRKR